MVQTQFELGKQLYHDWRIAETDNIHQKIRELGKENILFEEIKLGFISERCNFLFKKTDEEDVECFYGAMDEVGTQYWA
ncbi:hypothetical protein PP175_28270 (plasmid) [Aneurinibacillus sp. Ricciae_BoGa-3]|uniref:hypothetical protein n=1 Tax=Aneurinibacillus sp. Ricciae_BoGa-3 TaxID=3022697 RepID=UPI002340C7DA|nr:hypothetical protein [Aneurinibacillus sp. Ricciae_BoGa-3]WCK57087.1 hypothetical protein PP175_28270 [Aneurinibacillus sp. Ricciae_BoGa-3]